MMRTRTVFIGNEDFARRLVDARKSKGWKQQDLADAMTELQRGTNRLPVRAQTVSSWEAGHVPRPGTLDTLCKALGVTSDYLLNGETATIVTDNEQVKLREIKNLKELLLYGGEPLFMKPRGGYGRWVLVDDIHKQLVSVIHEPVDITKIKEGDYAFFTSYPYARDSFMPLEEAKTAEKVFIVPVDVPMDKIAMFRGWYSYEDSTDCFIRNKSAFVLPASEYGVSYFGFRDIPRVKIWSE